jgi:hypothetical protein
MRTRTLPAVAIVLVLTPLAAACGGGASGNGSSGTAAVSSHAGTTTVTGSAAGHSFQAQITTLGNLLDRVSKMSGSTGSGRVEMTLGGLRRGLTNARTKLAATSFPSVVHSQKRQLMQALARWDVDLAHAQQSARNGNTSQALHQAKSSTFRDLKALVDTVMAAASL